MSWLGVVLHRSRRKARVEERQAQEELRRHQERLSLAQKAGRIGHFDWDILTNENIWSEELEALYGLPPGGFGRNYESWVELVHPEDVARAEQDAQRSLVDGELSSSWRTIWPDGTIRWMQARGQVFFDDAGRPIRMAGINMDVTDLKRAEEALQASERNLEDSLRRQTEALQEADRHKNEFLAMLAHELRNPLAPIQNGLQILALRGEDPKVVAQVRELMERQVRQVVRLVDDLLEISRISRGKLKLEKVPLDLAGVVATAVETSRPLIEARRHELTVTPPAHPVRIEADPARLAQVLSNLLNNAAKYTETGGRIHLTAGQEDGKAVLRVRDTGVGIAPDMLPQIFDLFTQVESTLDRSQGGLGIGLTLARRLVVMHDGTIEAHSDGIGRGSEFVVRLPALPVN